MSAGAFGVVVEPHVRLIFCTHDGWEAHALVGCNRLPELVRDGAAKWAEMVGLMGEYLYGAETGVRVWPCSPGAEDCFARLNAELPFRAFPDRRPRVAYFRTPNVHANLTGALIAAKASLDWLHAGVLGPLSGWRGGTKGPESFKKLGNDPGGRVLKWLLNPSQCRLPRASEVGALVRQEKSEWVDDAIRKRDAICHRGCFPPSFVDFHVLLEAGRATPYAPEDLYFPSVELNGRRVLVTEYCRVLREGVSRFVPECSSLLSEGTATRAQNPPPACT
jgi:hypothetical protein